MPVKIHAHFGTMLKLASELGKAKQDKQERQSKLPKHKPLTIAIVK
jgi:hypothetical protein